MPGSLQGIFCTVLYLLGLSTRPIPYGLCIIPHTSLEAVTKESTDHTHKLLPGLLTIRETKVKQHR